MSGVTCPYATRLGSLAATLLGGGPPELEEEGAAGRFGPAEQLDADIAGFSFWSG